MYNLIIENLSEDDCDKEVDEISEVGERVTYGLISLSCKVVFLWIWDLIRVS